MTFKRINSCSTGDPPRLDRELSQLEDNIDAEFNLARKQLAPQAQPIKFTAVGVNTIAALLPDQQISIDTSVVSAAAVLPPLSSENFGKRFIMIKPVAGGSIVTSCQDSAVLCNGAAFPTFTAIGVTVFYCDSQGYYR